MEITSNRKFERRVIILYLLCCVSTLCISGQTINQPSSKIHPGRLINFESGELKVGDIVPNIEFNMLNYRDSKGSLSDFRGKLIILDFWATWCTSCIGKFSKLDSLQRRFGNVLQIILVNSKSTGDDDKKVEEFLRKWKEKYNNFSLPIAIKDSVADLLFVHNLIPHYVWIDFNGKVTAITASEQVTGENIKKLVEGDIVELPPKKDIDADRPFYLSNDISIDDFLHYSIFIRGKLNGLPSGNRLRYSGSIIRGRAMSNTTLLEMYRSFANELIADFRYSDKRLMLEVEDSTKLILNKAKLNEDAWNKANLYTYELIVPTSESKKLYRIMLDDLNRYSDYYGRIEIRKVKCLILVITGKSTKLYTSGGKLENMLYDMDKRYLINAPVSYLISFLDEAVSTQLPIIDETQLASYIDIQLPAECKSIEEYRKVLQQYGLDLVEADRAISVFVISDKIKADN